MGVSLVRSEKASQRSDKRLRGFFNSSKENMKHPKITAARSGKARLQYEVR